MDEYDQTPEGKFTRACLVRALFHFVPDQHGIVVEHSGELFTLVHDEDDIRIFKCEYDEQPGTIVPVRWQ